MIGGHVNALTTVRALSCAGVRCAVVSTRDYDIAHYSRFATESVILRDFAARPECLLELLEEKRPLWRGAAIFPTDDEGLSLLSKNHESLSRNYRPMCPEWDIASRLIHKECIYQAAAKAGVNLPTVYGRAPEAIPATGLPFPLLLKPDESHRFREAFGRKVAAVDGSQELAQFSRELERHQLSAHLMEWIPGSDRQFFNYSVYIDSRGNPVGGFAMRKWRKSPPFVGVCRVAQTITDTVLTRRLREATVETLRLLEWRGMANAEFKLDPRDGSLRLMEINGRCFLMQGLPLRGGVNYSAMTWQERMEGRAPVAARNGWQGFWIHLHADWLHAIFSRRREGLSWSDYREPYRHPNTYPVWSRNDPRPFWAEWRHSAIQAARWPFNSSLRRAWKTRLPPVPEQFDVTTTTE